MIYIVQELQESADNVVVFVPPETFADPVAAESDFYIKCGYAAISQVWLHTVMLHTDTGEVLRAKSYKHDANGTEEVTDNDPPAEE